MRPIEIRVVQMWVVFCGVVYAECGYNMNLPKNSEIIYQTKLKPYACNEQAGFAFESFWLPACLPAWQPYSLNNPVNEKLTNAFASLVMICFEQNVLRQWVKKYSACIEPERLQRPAIGPYPELDKSR
jgi:hypothetical protein